MKLGVRYILIKFSSAKSIHREIKLNVAKKKKPSVVLRFQKNCQKSLISSLAAR